MAERIPQSASYLVVFRAFLSSDGKTPATGKTIAITISKNGGAFGNPNVGALNATEISSGFYKFTLDATDTGTKGPLAWRGAEATINDAGDVLSVASAHNAGFDGVPDVAAGANNGLPLGNASGQVSPISNVKKNQALAKFEFLMTDSTNHNPVTGKTVSVTRSIDGGAFGAGTLSAVTEIANGIYSVDFAAGDLNGNVITLRATATGCDDSFERIVTTP